MITKVAEDEFYPVPNPSPQSAYDDGYRVGYKQALKDVGELMDELIDREEYFVQAGRAKFLRQTKDRLIEPLSRSFPG